MKHGSQKEDEKLKRFSSWGKMPQAPLLCRSTSADSGGCSFYLIPVVASDFCTRCVKTVQAQNNHIKHFSVPNLENVCCFSSFIIKGALSNSIFNLNTLQPFLEGQSKGKC